MELKNFRDGSTRVSRLGFGCWGIGKAMWVGAEDGESKRTLYRAIDQGVTLFDTALVYGDGHSEQLVGEVARAASQELFIATKLPSKKMEWPANDASRLHESFPKAYIIEQTEKSLKNLGRDYIDLQQFHVWNDAWADEDDWKEAVTQLKKDGKVRYFGISMNDHQPTNGIKAGKTGLIDCYQVIFNIFDQSPLDALLPFCEKENIAVLARVPLDEGGLTGNITPDTTFPEGDWRNYYFRENRKQLIMECVEKIKADIQGCCETVSEAALRFIISSPAVTSVIPGMRSEKNLLANVQAINKGALPPEVHKKLFSHRWIRNYYR